VRLFIVIFVLACFAGAAMAADDVQAAQDAADLVAMRTEHTKRAPGEYSMPLDLSEALHYRYFTRQMILARVTPDKFPQAWREIENTRQRHVARAKARLAGAARKAALDDPPPCPNNTICPVNILSVFGSPATNPQAFTVTAFSSIPAGPDYAMNSIALADAAGKVFAPATTVVQNGTGYDVVNNNFGVAPPPSVSPTVHAQGVWYYIPQGGGGIPGSFAATTTQGDNPTIVNTSPTNVKGNNQIKICVTRNDADCDYRYEASPGGYIVKFPVIGNVTYPNPIQADANNHPAFGVSNVRISQPNQGQGGGCKPLPIGQNLVQNATVSGNVVTWTINPASFGVATPCFPSNSTVIYDLMLTVFDTNNVPWIIAVTSQQGNPVQNTVRIQPTVVVYGCLAAGTKVTMADDTKKAIETIRVGERVRSNPQRIPLTVDNYTKGYEKPPMVAIRTAAGHELMMTDGHPVITTTGVKVARDLRLGDVVITEDGHSAIVGLDRPKYAGDVWNLDVGLPSDGVMITETNTTFFANGILVGDGRMQGRLDRAHHETPAEIMKRIGEKWRVDYLSAQELQRERERSGR
jgi:hypothetical protein